MSKLNNPLDLSFNPNIPIAVPISSYFLEANGWKKEGFVWTKGGDKIVYDGAVWKYNGEVVYHVEDIK